MTGIERGTPPLTADERTNLESWLDFYRATLLQKFEGLTEEQVRTAAAPPSPLTLLGLVQHMAEVERNWFRRVLLGEDVPPVRPKDGDGRHDGGFALTEDVSARTARTTLQDEIARARANCAGCDLAQTGSFGRGAVSLRWIYTHMIGEYARHCGHADLLRERIDGTTGV
ncbi:DinB family protein [Saccharopolyspora sp. HNM0983]|uniref:DinB family protein n=1 Tax=Saccharopolyspora montiporae TaxID=2781240 RepID=A0A929B8T8_9PSEU|nr:DinB family protein [Saccharopolyspora sp. HNM0983]MBE9375389.1 DinB family protein [Saccharopolyspora sp. HNM0983]